MNTKKHTEVLTPSQQHLPVQHCFFCWVVFLYTSPAMSKKRLQFVDSADWFRTLISGFLAPDPLVLLLYIYIECFHAYFAFPGKV
jgi:hypothetical protein